MGEGRLLIGRVQWKLETAGLGVSENPRLSIQHKCMPLTMSRLMSFHSCSFVGRTLEEVNCIVLNAEGKKHATCLLYVSCRGNKTHQYKMILDEWRNGGNEMNFPRAFAPI